MDSIWSILSGIGISESVFQFMLVNAILGLSIYLTLYTGMFSLANAGFMAIGAYVGVIATQTLGWPLGLALVAGMIAGAIVALPLGFPVLRLKDIYLAIATIGFGEIVRIVILNFDQLATQITGERVRITQGALGIKGIPKVTETWHLVLFLVLAGYFLVRLNRTRFGRAMAAIRQDEVVAATMGINPVYYKSAVFVLSAMLAAAAGVFSGHLTRIIGPNDFGFNRVVDILAFAVLGGTSTWVGPIVGGIVLTALPEMMRFLKQYNQIFNGLVLLGVIIYLPGGIVDPAGWRRFWRRLRGERGDPAPASSGEVP